MGDALLQPNDLIDIRRKGERLVIRFAAPAAKNPLSSKVLDLIENALDASADESDPVEIVFTGTNDVFAAGADLREINGLTSEAAIEFGLRGQRLMNRIAAMPLTTLAAINGFCYGGALDLALACKQRVASSNATFCHPGTSIGIITGWGGTQRLPKLIGEGRALEMFFTASPVSAVRAKAIGLVDAVDDAFFEDLN